MTQQVKSKRDFIWYSIIAVTVWTLLALALNGCGGRGYLANYNVEVLPYGGEDMLPPEDAMNAALWYTVQALAQTFDPDEVADTLREADVLAYFRESRAPVEVCGHNCAAFKCDTSDWCAGQFIYDRVIVVAYLGDPLWESAVGHELLHLLRYQLMGAVRDKDSDPHHLDETFWLAGCAEYYSWEYCMANTYEGQIKQALLDWYRRR